MSLIPLTGAETLFNKDTQMILESSECPPGNYKIEASLLFVIVLFVRTHIEKWS